MKSIDLDFAYAWTCPKCGAREFTEAVPIELNFEEAVEMARESGLPIAAQNGFWKDEPEEVECGKCGGVFEVEGDDDE